MKKQIIMVLCFVLAFSLVGCRTKSIGNSSDVTSRENLPNNSEVIDTEITQNTTHETNKDTEKSKGTDYTVRGDFKEYTNIESKNIIQVSANLDFSRGFPDLDSLVSSSDAIIECVVDEVKYTFIEGSCYTVPNVTVTESFKGNLNIGDRISILQYGGYFTIEEETDYWHDEDKFSNLNEEERKNSLIYSHADVGVDYHVGDVFVMFVSTEDFLEGSYCTLKYGEGVFVYQNDEILTRYCGNKGYQNEIKYSDLLAIKE